MGGAGSIELKAGTDEESELMGKELAAILDDKAKMDALFNDIAMSVEESRINIKNKISVINLLHYHTSKKNEWFNKVVTDQMILLEAHKYSCSDKEKKKKDPLLVRSRLKQLLTSIFYFSTLWKVFDTLDCVVSDNKLHKGEFIKATKMLATIVGVGCIVIGTPEEITKEFDTFDRDNNGSISFNEFVTYCTSKISTPEDFHADDDELDDVVDVAEQDSSATSPTPTPEPKEFISAKEAVLAMERADTETWPWIDPSQPSLTPLPYTLPSDTDTEIGFGGLGVIGETDEVELATAEGAATIAATNKSIETKPKRRDSKMGSFSSKGSSKVSSSKGSSKGVSSKGSSKG